MFATEWTPWKMYWIHLNFFKFQLRAKGKLIFNQPHKKVEKNKIKCGGGGCLLKWSWSHLLLEVKFQSSRGKGQGWQDIPGLGKGMSNQRRSQGGVTPRTWSRPEWPEKDLGRGQVANEVEKSARRGELKIALGPQEENLNFVSQSVQSHIIFWKRACLNHHQMEETRPTCLQDDPLRCWSPPAGCLPTSPQPPTREAFPMPFALSKSQTPAKPV